MRLNLTLCLLFAALACFAQKGDTHQRSELKEGFAIQFDETHQNFGMIKRGEIRKTKFFFTNTGTEDIKIELVSSCECTTLDWPRAAIKPGQQGVIDVSFDSSKKEESETVEIDINFENIDPNTGFKRFEIVRYSYEFIP